MAPGILFLGSLGQMHDCLGTLSHVRPRSLHHNVQYFVEGRDTAGIRPLEICTVELSPIHSGDHKWDRYTHDRYWLALIDHHESLGQADIAVDALDHPDEHKLGTANCLLGIDFAPVVWILTVGVRGCADHCVRVPLLLVSVVQEIFHHHCVYCPHNTCCPHSHPR